MSGADFSLVDSIHPRRRSGRVAERTGGGIRGSGGINGDEELEGDVKGKSGEGGIHHVDKKDNNSIGSNDTSYMYQLPVESNDARRDIVGSNPSVHHQNLGDSDSDSSELSDPPDSDEFDGFETDEEHAVNEFSSTHNEYLERDERDAGDADSPFGSKLPLSRILFPKQELFNKSLPEENEHALLNRIGEDIHGSSDSPLSSISISSLSPQSPKQPPSPKSPQIQPPTLPTKSPKKKIITKSPYFPPTPSKKPTLPKSCIPFPPLSSPTFGLIQEKLYQTPFWLLVATTFLTKTRGKVAIPVFYQLLEKYKTPEGLAEADAEEVREMIAHLGLGVRRAGMVIGMARGWVENPPVRGRRFRKLGYPTPGDGRDISVGEILSDEDLRDGAWEIGHLGGVGAYALDSWRIFCRDVLRGVAGDYDGKDHGAVDGEKGFEPEWMRVVPHDKELRAYLKWMWLKEGWDWDPLTGEKEVAGEELVRAAGEGRLVWVEEGDGGLVLREVDG